MWLLQRDSLLCWRYLRVYHRAQYGNLCFSIFILVYYLLLFSFLLLLVTLMIILCWRLSPWNRTDTELLQMNSIVTLQHCFSLVSSGSLILLLWRLLVSLKQVTIDHPPCALTIVQLLRHHHLRSWGSCLTALLFGVLMWKTKQRLVQLCHFSAYLEPAGLSIYNV